MKNQFLLLFLLSGLLFTACGSDSSSQAVETGDAKEAAPASTAASSFAIDTENSVVNWEGYKPGQYGHSGVIKIQSGQIGVKDGAVESGKFVIDMTSLSCTDLADNPEKQAKLEGHLKSGDFFEVEKFPTASFEVTGVKAAAAGGEGTHTVTGNLTMKNITKSIEIPAKVRMDGGKIHIETPEFTINRTEWDVKFNSGLAGAVGDAIIADDVKLSIRLVGSAG